MFLRALGGQLHYYSSKNAGVSGGVEFRGYQNDSPMGRPQEEATVMVMRSENPSMLDEGYSKNLGDIPNFQDGDNANREGNIYMKEMNTTKMATGPDF